jgi:hypothetical protein
MTKHGMMRHNPEVVVFFKKMSNNLESAFSTRNNAKKEAVAFTPTTSRGETIYAF